MKVKEGFLLVLVQADNKAWEEVSNLQSLEGGGDKDNAKNSYEEFYPDDDDDEKTTSI